MKKQLFSVIGLLTVAVALTHCGGGGDSGGGGVGVTVVRHSTVYVPYQNYGQQSTKLQNGNVLVTGGFNSSNNPTDRAYIYNVNSSTFSEADTLKSLNYHVLFEPRALHAQALVAGSGGAYAGQGSVLIVGGITTGGLSGTAEVYDPVFGSVTRVGNLNYHRKNHTVTEIDAPGTPLNGQLLIVGGETSSGITGTAEVFDPYRGTFALLSNRLNIPREEHTATALPNGKILIAGGRTNAGGGNTAATDTGELFDPASLSFSLVSNVMTEKRMYHTATFLNNKTTYDTTDDAVLIAGGLDAFGFALDNADLFYYDAIFQQYRFVPVSSRLKEPVFRHAAAALPNTYLTDVVITGGFTNLNTFNTLDSNPTEQVQVFNYHYLSSGPTGTFDPTWSMLYRRALHTSNHIRLGTILSLGGVDGVGNARTTGEEFYY